MSQKLSPQQKQNVNLLRTLVLTFLTGSLIFAGVYGLMKTEATEICGNGIDDDGDGKVDAVDLDCFSYGKYITVYESQIPGTAPLIDFPVLISVTDAELRSAAQGGYVQHSSGYDIQFRLGDGTTLLSHQIESYEAATGTLVAWVKVPSLSATVNTTLQMHYGNASVTTDPSANTTWDAAYMNVCHFNNSVANASGGGVALTDVGTTHLAAGKIAGARDLDNPTDVSSSLSTGKHLRLPNAAFSGVNNFTFEGWVYLDRATTNWERIFDFGKNTAINYFFTPSAGTPTQAEARARITINNNGNEQGPVSAAQTNTGAWIHWAVVLDDAANTMQLYKNGALLSSASNVTLKPSSVEASTSNYYGRSQYGADHYIDAKFDEFRISSTARSSAWITASYNNQSSPSTFFSMSNYSFPVEWLSFEAAESGGRAELNWVTAREQNSDYFEVERAGNDGKFTALGQVAAAGTTDQRQEYGFTDEHPASAGDRVYYRLRQVDLDGQFSYSKTVELVLGASASELSLRLAPNPASSQVRISASGLGERGGQILILSLAGQEVWRGNIGEGAEQELDVSAWPRGTYYIRLSEGARLARQTLVVQ